MARKKFEQEKHARHPEKRSPQPPAGTSTASGMAVESTSNGQSYLRDNQHHYACFQAQLGLLGLALRDIQGDGNCLFRALGDQLEGHGRNHIQHRLATVTYMREHREDFEPFIEDNISFHQYIENLSKPGTYAGQDSIVSFARLHSATVIIHQLDSPLWQIEGGPPSGLQIHLSYHNGEHYSSVRKIGDCREARANVRLPTKGTDFGNRSKVVGKFSMSEVVVASPPPSSADVDEEETSFPEATSDLVHMIMENSGVHDAILVADALEMHMYDQESTVDYLLNLALITRTSPCSDIVRKPSQGLTIDIGDNEERPSSNIVCGARPKTTNGQQAAKRLSNKQRKELHRLNKAERTRNRKLEQEQFAASENSGPALEDPRVLNSLGCLNL